MRTVTVRKTWIVAAVIVAAGCLAPRAKTPPTVAVDRRAAPAVPVEVQPPAAGPQGEEPRARPIFKVVPKPESLSATESLFAVKPGGPKSPRLIYFNANGGTYTHGPDDSTINRSSVAPKTTSIPPYEKSSRAKVLGCVQEQFARWAITVTDADPGDAPHVEVVLGGSPSLLGLDKYTGGVAPMYPDCSMVERAVVFVFSKAFKDPQEECEVVAHEVGHAIGLDHEYLCKDPTTYLYGCGKKAFQNVDAACGEDGPRACMCGGKQNSVRFMDDRLGLAASTPPIALPPIGAPPPITLPPIGTTPPVATTPPAPTGTTPPPPTKPPSKGDGEPPRIALLAPPSGAKLPDGSVVHVAAHVQDEAGLKSVSLLWTVAGKTTEIDCASPPSGVTCSSFLGAYTWKLPAGSGTRLWAVRAIDNNGTERVSAERAMTLGDGEPKPEAPTQTPPASGAPSSNVTSPAQGAVFHFGSSIPVRVDVDGAVESVQLLWQTPAGDELHPLAKLDGNSWGLDLAIPKLTFPGLRTIRVRVTSASGTSTTPDRIVTILP